MWPHGEEWVHEAMSETYLPLLNALYDLMEEGFKYRITVSVSPQEGFLHQRSPLDTLGLDAPESDCTAFQ